MLLDNLSLLIDTYGFDTVVFHAGEFCGKTDFDASQNVGHLHLIRSGKVIIEHEHGAPAILEGPAVVLYPRPLNHRLVVPPESKADLVCADLIFRSGRRNPFAAALPDWLMMPANACPEIEEVTELMFRRARRNEDGSGFILNHLSDILVFEIIRYALKQRLVAPSVLAGISDQGISAAVAAIHASPATGWRLETLAARASMSRSKFAKRFHELMGVTPARYVSDIRLALAEGLLQKNASIKVVANSVGYSNQAAFTKAFTARHGLSPNQWRRQSTAIAVG